MPPVDRNNPMRGASSESTYSLTEFMRECPNDAACLDMLWRQRFAPDGHQAECSKCERTRKFHRVRSRPNYACDSCGCHLRPLAGTIFHKSSTSLHLWFYAMYLMASTRCGVSAKHLERELGVTYKTAWRMFNLIRNKLMTEDDGVLSGDIEIDECSVDGKPKRKQGERISTATTRSDAAKLRERSRATVVAAVERGGRIKTTVMDSRRGPALERQVIRWVAAESIIFTDEWPSHNGLDQHFVAHSRSNHSTGMYVEGDTHTNRVEGLFGNLKAGHPWELPEGVSRVAKGLPERVCVALQPPLLRRPLHVPPARQQSRYDDDAPASLSAPV
jgi:transposase